MAILGIDHIIIIGHQLETMVKGFQNLGFTVIPGGRHSTGTHNALIALADGAYIELLAFWKPMPGSRRWQMLQSGGGLSEFMLTSSDINCDVEAVRKRGISYRDPVQGFRTRPDGKVVRWKDGPSPERSQLPFLIEDVTARVLRVPGGEARIHANGVTGIKQLFIRTNDLQSTAKQYCRFLGQPPSSVCSNPDNVAVREWQFDFQRLTVFQDTSDDGRDETAVELFHEPYRCVLYGPWDKTLDPALATGARIRVEAR